MFVGLGENFDGDVFWDVVVFDEILYEIEFGF